MQMVKKAETDVEKLSNMFRKASINSIRKKRRVSKQITKFEIDLAWERFDYLRGDFKEETLLSDLFDMKL